MALKENYKDDILDTSQNVKRKYQMENNGDGTVSFTDVTEYTQQGDSFGASDINATNTAVNNLNHDLSGFKFYPTGTQIVGLISDDSAYMDEDGNYVVWGTPTANQLVADNPNTYKSVPSEEDTRGMVGADTGSPFSNKFDYNNLIPIQGNAKVYCTTEIGHTYLCCIAVFDSRNRHDITNDIVGGELLKNYGVVESAKTVNPKTYITLHLCVIRATSNQISWLGATHDVSGTNANFGCFQVFDISDFV